MKMIIHCYPHHVVDGISSGRNSIKINSRIIRAINKPMLKAEKKCTKKMLLLRYQVLFPWRPSLSSRNKPAKTFPNPVPMSFSARLLYINPRIASIKDAQ